MSRSNQPQQKKLRKLRKAFRRQLPRYIDIIYWLKTRGYANTSGEAKQLILDGRLRSESHTIGIVQDPTTIDERDVVERLQPAFIKDTLRVEDKK